MNNELAQASAPSVNLCIWVAEWKNVERRQMQYLLLCIASSSQNILQNFSYSSSHQILQHMHDKRNN